jgi:SHS2 domain-containing protein
VPGGFTIIEHPSDLGIEASGGSMEEAFAFAAEGLMSVIVDPSTVAPRESRDIRLPAMDEERLLVRWLGEVLYLYDGAGFVSSGFIVTGASEAGLAASAQGEPADPRRHRLRLDVKAVTYHGVSVKRSAGLCAVRVFLDI